MFKWYRFTHIDIVKAVMATEKEAENEKDIENKDFLKNHQISYKHIVDMKYLILKFSSFFFQNTFWTTVIIYYISLYLLHIYFIISNIRLVIVFGLEII